MTKITMIAVISVQLVLLVHAIITIQKLQADIAEQQMLYERSFDNGLLLPDYGNDRSQ